MRRGRKRPPARRRSPRDGRRAPLRGHSENAISGSRVPGRRLSLAIRPSCARTSWRYARTPAASAPCGRKASPGPAAAGWGALRRSFWPGRLRTRGARRGRSASGCMPCTTRPPGRRRCRARPRRRRVLPSSTRIGAFASVCRSAAAAARKPSAAKASWSARSTITCVACGRTPRRQIRSVRPRHGGRNRGSSVPQARGRGAPDVGDVGDDAICARRERRHGRDIAPSKTSCGTTNRCRTLVVTSLPLRVHSSRSSGANGLVR